MRAVLNIKNTIISKPTFYFRCVLFVAFFGHALVSLGFSPSYNLHYGIADAINITPFSTKTFVTFFGCFDLLMAMFIISKQYPKIVLRIALAYLVLVGIAAICFFKVKTESAFGIAEFMRRMPWMFFTIYLLIEASTQQTKAFIIRYGVSFAFLAHGLASMGFLGLKGGHIELATQIVSKQQADVFVFYSGITDSIIGISLFTGLFSRFIAPIGACWILVIVILSYMNSIPDGIFRTGFLLAAFYVAIEPKCHKRKMISVYNNKFTLII